jgi:hypothetical protein
VIARSPLPLVAWLAIAPACHDGGGGSGDDDGGSGDDDGGSADIGSDDGVDDGVPACEDDPGPTPLRRLTHREYDATIRDLLGDDSHPSATFPVETSPTGFDNEAQALDVDGMLAEEYLAAAETIAAAADLAALLPCDPAVDGEDACAAEFIAELGLRAFRRPLDADLEARYVALFADSRDAWGFDRALELVVVAMLQSPRLLYRVELGLADDDGDAKVRLDDWEIASRLSYLLWGSMPDDELFAAASAGELATPDQVRGQTERMLDDPRARAMVSEFHAQWLKLPALATISKDEAVYPGFDALRPAFEAETRAFVEHVVFDGEGDVQTLLTAPYTFVNDELAALYGVALPAGTALERVDLPAGQRAGLLTQGAVLAVHAKPDQSSPVLRGRFVRERLLCEAMPEPPANVDTTPPEVDPDASTRDRFEQHTSDPTCATCHVLLDPLGFGLEHYDGIGRWRDVDGASAVDASGSIRTSAGDVPFDGALELAAWLADSSQVRACVVTQWFTWSHGRAPDLVDACTTETLVDAFTAADGDIRELLVALTQTEAFYYLASDGG